MPLAHLLFLHMIGHHITAGKQHEVQHIGEDEPYQGNMKEEQHQFYGNAQQRARNLSLDHILIFYDCREIVADDGE